MKKRTHHARMGLCMVIGMLLGGFLAICAQDIAKINTTYNFNSSSRVRPLTIERQVSNLQFQIIHNYKSKATCRLHSPFFPETECPAKELENNLQV